MTWKEFLECVQREGVKPEDEIDYIDIAEHRPAPLEIFIEEKGKNKRELTIWN